MTLTIILWTAALAIFFGITNAISYQRGNDTGYTEGLEDGIGASFLELKNGEYEIRITDKKED